MSLMLVLQVLKRRLWLVGAAFIATMVGALVMLLVVPPRYESVASASIDPNIADPVSGQTTGVNTMIMQGNLIALAKSAQVAMAVVKRLNLDADPAIQSEYRSSSASGVVDVRQWFAERILERVDAKFLGGSNVLNITYKSPSSQQASLFANAFMSAFIDAAIAQKVGAAQKTAEWFSPQIEKIRADLLAAREKLANFQADAKLLAPTGLADAESNQLVAVTNELSKARADLVVMEGQMAAPVPTAAASNDAQTMDLQVLGSLHTAMSTLDGEIARLQTEVGVNNPKLKERMAAKQSLQKQIDAQFVDFHNKLADRIQTQKTKIATLEKAYAEKVQGMIGIQAQREKLESFRKDVNLYQDELERALKTENQARLQSQLSFSNIAILDQAVPPISPAFPKKIVVAMLALFLGLTLGMMLALLAEALDRRMRSAQDLEHATGSRLLGAVPNINPGRSAAGMLRIVQRLPFMPFRRSSADAKALAKV